MKCFIILLFIHILITNGNIYKCINNKFLKNDIKNNNILLKKNIINYIINFEKKILFSSSNINIIDIVLLFN